MRNPRPYYSRPYQGTSGVSLRDKVAADIFTKFVNEHTQTGSLPSRAEFAVQAADALMEALDASRERD